MDKNKKLKKVVVASAFVAATSLSATVVSALEEDRANTQNAVVETTSLSENEVSPVSAVQTGWVQEDDRWYYYDDQGEPATGVYEIEGVYYCFLDNGQLAMFDGDYECVGVFGNYIAAFNGKGITEDYMAIVGGQLVNFHGSKYYYDENLEPYTGFKTIDGQLYYVEYGAVKAAYGDEKTAGFVVDDTIIIVDQEGHVIDQAKVVGNQWIYVGDKTYYFDENLEPYRGLREVEGQMYYFDWDGSLMTFDESDSDYYGETDDVLFRYNCRGEVIEYAEKKANEWVEFDDSWYYYDGNLNPYEGIHTINGIKYYFYEGGRLATYDYGDNHIEISNGQLIAITNDGVVKEQKTIKLNDWTDFQGDWYYYGADGQPYVGAHEINGTTYFFMYDGRLVTFDWDGIQVIYMDDKMTAVNNKGEVIDQVTIEANKLIDFNGEKYYFDENLEGVNGFYSFDGKEYYFIDGQLASDYDGVMKNFGNTFVYLEKGEVIDKYQWTNGEVFYFRDNYHCFYYDEENELTYGANGIVEHDGKELYFKDGVLQRLVEGYTNYGYDDNYIFIYNHNGEVLYKVAKKRGWNHFVTAEYDRDIWFYFNDDLSPVSGITKVGDKEYLFFDSQLFMADEDEDTMYIMEEEDEKETIYIIAYNNKGEITDKRVVTHGGWYEIKGVWYYILDNLEPADGFLTIGGKTYLFNGGVMETADESALEVRLTYDNEEDTFVIYTIDKDGVVKEHKNTAPGWLEFNGSWYYFDESGYPSYFGWHEVDGETYYFGELGLMMTGWIQEDTDTWYYLDKDGHKTIGWATINGKKYYFDQDGKMTTGDSEAKSGWVQEGNKWYYYENNRAVKGYYTVANTKYYFDADGVMQTGWFKINGDDYYATSSGSITAQWVGSGNNWYYVDADGKMVTGFQTLSGTKYFFETNGLMKKGWFKVNGTDYYASTSGEIKAQWVGSGNNWYYVDADGKMVTGFQTISGSKYYFETNGLMKKGWFVVDGTDYYASTSGEIKAQWVGSGNTWYYVDADGKMVTGYQTIAGAKYYFASSGLMQTGWFKINGADYYAASSGVISAQWVGSGNTWYYVDAEGKMVTGDYKINGVVNYFDVNGIWLGQ